MLYCLLLFCFAEYSTNLEFSDKPLILSSSFDTATLMVASCPDVIHSTTFTVCWSCRLSALTEVYIRSMVSVSDCGLCVISFNCSSGVSPMMKAARYSLGVIPIFITQTLKQNLASARRSKLNKKNSFFAFQTRQFCVVFKLIHKVLCRFVCLARKGWQLELWHFSTVHMC